MNLEVRWMLESDVSEAVAIENCWDYLSKWGAEGYLRVLRHPCVYCSLVAEARLPRDLSSSNSRTVVGLAVLALMVDHGELCNLIVPPQYLGKTVGQQLLAHCLEVARQHKLHQVILEVRHSNRRAIRFYERNGFKIISRRKNYYRDPAEDAWVMGRPTSTTPPRESGWP